MSKEFRLRLEGAVGGGANVQGGTAYGEFSMQPGAVASMDLNGSGRRWRAELNTFGLLSTGGSKRFDLLPGIGLSRFDLRRHVVLSMSGDSREVDGDNNGGLALHAGPALRFVGDNKATGFFISASGYAQDDTAAFLRLVGTVYPNSNEYGITVLLGVGVF